MKASGRYHVIGLGGVGGTVLRRLVQYLDLEERGATIFAIDGDFFEEHNRSRQSFARLGPKPIVLAEELAPRFDRVSLVPVPEYLTAQRARHLIGEGDVIFCAPDNHATRRLTERRCARQDDMALFSGGNDGREDGSGGTYGNVQIYWREGGRDRTNPLSRFHPEIERPRDRLPTQLGCQAQLPSAPQLSFINLMVAAAMLGAFYSWRHGELRYEELYFDIASGRMVPVRRELACGRGAATAGKGIAKGAKTAGKEIAKGAREIGHGFRDAVDGDRAPKAIGPAATTSSAARKAPMSR